MKRLQFIAVLAFFAVSQAQDITTAERERGLDYLKQTNSALVDATRGLSEAQWNFKPAPDRWSVAETLEHITIVEQFFGSGVARQLSNAPAPAATHDTKQIDSMILARVPDRTTKFKAPESITPTGRWTPDETLANFLGSRKQTVEFLKTRTDLRGHVIDHPAFGPLDGYEWILAVAAHTERHTKQILEVKAAPNFPVK